jgi:outer membrane protein assembly factor BamD (BamD/ComL family)
VVEPPPNQVAGASYGGKVPSWREVKQTLGLVPPDTTPPVAADTLVLRADGLAPDRGKIILVDERGRPTAEGRMASAREAFRREEYVKAEDLFYDIAESKDTPPNLAAEAIFYRAECLRLQGHYPKAADVYVDLLNKFPVCAYREQATQHMYDIANYWLNDTREEMREEQERRQGKRWFVWPRFISFDKTKPTLDREGRAVEKLEQVRLADMNGPLADQALFMAGTVKLYNENYREADHYFSQIQKKHPNSKLAPKALELAIFCKHMSTGGSDYDGRKVAEARDLVQAAFRNYQELATEKREFLDKQLKGITLQQAEKDYKIAEFYRRTGHPGSAYWYYEVVRRRYPGTKYADLAGQRMIDLRGKLEKEQSKLPAVAPANTGPPATPGAPQAVPQSAPAPSPVGPPASPPGR